ncbi:MAG: hypothetical protein KHZ24_08555 [Coriobacteriia bacterium]|nr:hypothetical protein [Coriobacteriia bacterium]
MTVRVWGVGVRRPGSPISTGLATLAVAVALGGAAGCSLPGAAPSGASDQPAVTSSIARDSASADSASTEPSAAPAGSIASVAVRSTVDEYSWTELSQLAQAISAAPDDAAGQAIAIEHHLCNADGTLDGTQVKMLHLEGVPGDPAGIPVQIVGFRHDDRADGAGKAGISFMYANADIAFYMNDDGDEDPYTDSNVGGWEASGMRNVLPGVTLKFFPSDLKDLVVPVNKLTNNAGVDAPRESTDAETLPFQPVDPAAITVTSDRVWLPSVAELVDPATLPLGQQYIDAYAPEGSQYQLFADLGTRAYEDWSGDPTLIRVMADGDEAEPVDWWTRSPVPGVGHSFTGVSRYGVIGGGYAASLELCIVPGFCL